VLLLGAADLALQAEAKLPWLAVVRLLAAAARWRQASIEQV